MQKPEVTFLSVRDSRTKLGKIVTLCHELFAKGERLLIRLPDEKAADFLDEHLWRVPEESFLPHEITYEMSDSPIILTTADRNLNHATALLHLCPEPCEMPLRFQHIYDLKDESGPERLEASRNRYRDYHKRGFTISVQ